MTNMKSDLEQNEFILHPLTPVSSIKSTSSYIKYLENALTNNEINNIALTGNYGSGKSSILKTFLSQKEYKNHYLQVSLSTFSKSKTEDNANSIKLNLEKSIINQILYQIPTKSIPLTNFRVKREFSKIQSLLIVSEFILISSLIIPINLFSKDFTTWKYIFLLGFLSWNLYSVIKYIPIKKFNLKHNNVEIELESKNDELFEKYSDEIIYILKKSKKNILVIEDLDRFNQLKIFEQLRELNIKLNNALNTPSKIEKVFDLLPNKAKIVYDSITKYIYSVLYFLFKKKKINNFVFIYAIKDDLFIEHSERTKFFDLVIPVIPFISYSNSYEQMKILFSKYNVDQQLLLNLCYFISDMRTLYNIYNEFNIFNIELGSLKSNNLLAIIVYKNLYNLDFELLKKRKGILYNTFQSVDKYKAKINDDITKLKDKLRELDKEYVKSKEELFILWLIDNGVDERTVISYKNYMNDPTDQFYNRNTSTYYNYNKVKTTPDYQKRLQIVENFDDRNEINERIEKLEKILTGKIKDIISEVSINEIDENILDVTNIDEKLQLSFIQRMLHLGFIDENYSHYLNYNYGSEQDSTFILGVFSNDRTIDFDLKLNDFEKLMDTLSEKDFNKMSILNFSLLKFLFESNNSNRIIQVLEVGKKSQHNFLESFYNYCGNIDIKNQLISYLSQPNSTFKFDLTKLIKIENSLIENNLFIANDENFKIIVFDIWENKLSNKEEVENLLKWDNPLEELFLVYFIMELRVRIDLDNINTTFYSHLMERSHVIPSSNNINLYYKHISEIDKTLIKFINENDIEDYEGLNDELVYNLINNNTINDQKYIDILKNSNIENQSIKIDDIDEQISNGNLQNLIDLNLIEISPETIEILEKHNTKYVPKNVKKVADLIMEDNQLVVSDLLSIINSSEIEEKYRKQIFLDNISQFNLNAVINFVDANKFDKRIKNVLKKTKNFFNHKFIKTPENVNEYEEIKVILGFLLSKGEINENQYSHMLGED